MESIPYLAGLSAIAALLLAGYFFKLVGAAPPGDERMVFLMTEIQKGAKAFLKKEYSWLSIFVVALAIVLAIVIAPLAAVTYVLGAVLSSLAGYIGMTVATMANARTTEAAKSGPAKALTVAFRGGAVMGFTVAGLALLGLAATYLVFVTWLEVDDAFEVVTAFGLGASSIALFSRVGGGIYTKAADVGADLVGHVPQPAGRIGVPRAYEVQEAALLERAHRAMAGGYRDVGEPGEFGQRQRAPSLAVGLEDLERAQGGAARAGLGVGGHRCSRGGVGSAAARRPVGRWGVPTAQPRYSECRQ